MDKKQYLTLEQNICSARVFLNVFGLILENQDNINEFSKLKIFNTKGEEVGILCFKDGKINVTANSNFGKLNAYYDVASVWGFNDIECGGVFAQWNNNIYFDVSSEDKLNFKGNIQIGCSMDSDFGIRCNTHSIVEYKQSENQVALKFMMDGSEFKYEINGKNEREIIDVSICNTLSNFMHHYIIKGEYDYDKHAFPYRKSARIKTKSFDENNILEALSFAEEYGELLSYSENYIPMIGKNQTEESTIQKGLLMQQIDPDFVKKIEEIKNTFISDDVSLFENLIDISFSSYSDEEVIALFGFEREKVNYQNGADNLVDAYYGIGEDNKFLSPKNQKRLLK